MFKQDRKYRVRRGVALGVVLTLWGLFGLDVIKAGVRAVFVPASEMGKALGVYDYSTERGR